MRRWSQPLVPLLLVLAVGVAVVDGRRAARPPRQESIPASAAAGQTPSAGAAAAEPAPGALSPRNANYRIEARLDAKSRRITGRQWLTWRNITGASTSELRYHLYYNAFKNTRSTFMREGENVDWLSRDDLSSLGEKSWGWTEVSKVELVDGGGAAPVDLTAGRRYIAPDDGNADDQTVMLGAAAADSRAGRDHRGLSRVDRAAFRGRSPAPGVVGDFFFLAQWFPKVGVLEDEGWNCHQFHAGTEFFSDYGVYDVQLTVPTRLGRRRDRRGARDRATTRTARRRTATTRKTSTTSRGRRARTTWCAPSAFEQPGLPTVEMRLLLQPEHAGQEARHFDATRAALALLRRVVRPLPVRPDHDCRSRLAERSGRHGVPHAVHRGLVAGSRRRTWPTPKA